MNRIILKLVLCSVFLVSSQIFAQEKQFIVHGTITDINGEPLGGTNVTVRGSNIRAISDSSGKFTITPSAMNDILIFDNVGFAKKEIPINGAEIVHAVLEYNSDPLNELVVIAYGKQARSTLTTSVSKVGSQEFKNAPGVNPLTQLQGKVAGVSIQLSDGQPGANPQIFIRGGSSTSPEGDAPLLIVDGIVGVMRNISDLNPDDVESMEVLKDAASTAIYGARAANGVIIITTKKGKAGKPQIGIKVSTGQDRQGNKYNFLNARDYIYVTRNNIASYNTTNPDFFLTGGRYGMSTGNPRNSNNTLEFLDVYIKNYGEEYVADLINKEGWETMDDPATGKKLIFKNTDFEQVTYNPANRFDIDANVSGGTENYNYYLGLGHTNQQGIVYGTYHKGYSGLFNGVMKLSNKLSLNTNFSFQLRNGNSPNNYNNVVSRSIKTPPTYRLRFEDGTPAPGEGISSFVPRLYEVYYKEKYTDVRIYRYTSKIGANWDIIPGLSFMPTLYYFTTEGVENRYEAFSSVYKNRNASAAHNFDRQSQLDGVFNYSKKIGKNHNINAVLGASYINTYAYRMSGSGRNAPTDYVVTLNATVPETQRITTTKNSDAMMSYFGRIDYNYKLKYLLSASLRSDGSSRFSEKKRYGYFPGASAGWNVHKESFWQPLAQYISNFKIRSSFGIVGNNDLSIFDTQGQYSTGYNYDGQAGLLNTTLANQNLVWEKTASFDLGLDIGFLNNRITLILDYYNKLTSDRLFSKPLDATSGFSSIMSNYGSIRNSGFEIELEAAPVRSKDFNWTINATFAYNKGVVVKLPANSEEKNRIGGNYVYDIATKTYKKVGGFAEGERFGQRWAYHLIGAYATDEDAANAPRDINASGRVKQGGDAIWDDLDGNRIIDNNDMIFMGYIRPDKTGGLVNTFGYKSISLRFVADWAVGHVIDNRFKADIMGSARNNNSALAEVLGSDIWKQQGDIATIPKYTVQSDFDYNFRNHLRWDNGIGSTAGSNNSLYFSKGDFFAFREVSLSYRLPSKWINTISLQNLEFFGSVYNIGYLTKYDGLMPEVYTGADPGLYPRPRQIIFGINATF
ncbi:SusC/RagA family TonB-linked outer membrane protein [Haoranjiania flava]|uniref:SusC/RagA family TonB-linked outer membrane protein n=1 Tax=Haoranjiania flava TaxID=1856322 RepID=A0AAE3IQC4_9BACT|nr:SusC/RagA family TonB-linked outer membrane protein [Haoranjiania flava]MCU7693872.1 SusC/RagA family TonB-linked outer membrane protein [Haoranjiania flava]